MNSTYKTDLGNGVVIYADDYIRSGQWIFDCKYSRLISRNPLPAPLTEMEKSGKLTIGDMYELSKDEELIAKDVIRTSTAAPAWYKNLRYLYSSLDEYSNLTAHAFDLLIEYEGRQWALIVWQDIESDRTSSFTITAEPYDPETYVDYAKALQNAAKSCPAPQ